jgi:uncharacterized membrane protein YccC
MSWTLTSLHGGTLRRALRSAFVLDRSRADLGFAVRCSVGVAIPLIGALAAGSPALGVPGAIGAMSVGFASQQGRYRTRAAVMLLTAAAMALATFAGALAGKTTLVLVFMMALWSYAYGVVSALGPSAASAGLNSVVALIIFSGQAAPGHSTLPATAALQALVVFAGGLLQTMLLVLIWPLRGYAAERRALSAVYRGLAAYARTIAGGKLDIPDAQKVAAAREVLADPQPFARRGDIAAFQSLLDCAERIRASLAMLASEKSARTGDLDGQATAAFGEVAAATAKLLDAVADGLGGARAPVATNQDWQSVEEAAEHADHISGPFGAHVGDETRALLGQLRSAWGLATLPARDAAAPSGEPGELPRAFPLFQDTLQTLRSSLSLGSPFGRHAVRLAATLGLATALSRGLAIDRGYWMTLTALLVLKPDFTTSFARGLLRIVGTLIGALLASGISLAVAPGPRGDVGFAILFAALGFLVINVNWGLFGVTVTAYVVFLFSLLGYSEHTAIVDRVLATLYGGGLAELAMFVWPTWEGKRAGEQLAVLFDALHRYAMLVLGAYADPTTFDPAKIHRAQAPAWTARLDAETSVDRAVGEPPQTQVLPAKALLGMLAAARRIGIALLALDAWLQHATPRPRPALRTFADALSTAFEHIAAGVRESRAPQALPPLRREFHAMRRELDERNDHEAALILGECDVLVDALNTAARLAVAGASEAHGKLVSTERAGSS